MKQEPFFRLFFQDIRCSPEENKRSDSYARLLFWEDNENARDLSLNGIGPDPRTELIVLFLVLEIQQGILKFVTRCCRLLLHDIPSKSLTSIDYPVRPGPSILFAVKAAYPSISASDFSEILAVQSSHFGSLCRSKG
jgi:hypothetical protein